MVKKIRNIFVLILSFCIFAFNTNFVFAGLVTCGGGDGQNPCTIEDLFGAGDASKGDPFWIDLIQKALGISGIVILCIFIVSGINIMLFGSNPEKLKKSISSMKGSFVGILLVFFAFTIVRASLMILVGDKWSIYFGVGNTTPVTPGSGCTQDSGCSSGQICCNTKNVEIFTGDCSVKGSCINKPKFIFNITSDTNKISNSAGNGVISNGDACKTVVKIVVEGVEKDKTITGKCAYIKKKIISSSYYPVEYNIVENADASNECDGRSRDSSKCTVIESVTYCLRCVKTDFYDKNKP